MVELKDTNWANEIKTFERGKFAPKLTFADQCAWFIIRVRFGVPLRDVAEAAGISVHTAFMLCSLQNKKYRNVKQEFALLGVVPMYDKYVENYHVERIQAINLARRPKLKDGVITVKGFPFVLTKKENRWEVEDHEGIIVGLFETQEQIKEACAEHIRELYNREV